MARRELFYTVEDDNRDKGKVFKIVEMSAFAAESWAIRFGLALARSGILLPDDLQQKLSTNEFGMADIATMGIQALAGLQYQEAKPLLDDMLACVQIFPDRKNAAISRELVPDDIEELSTLLELRKKTVGLHLNFSPAADARTMGQ